MNGSLFYSSSMETNCQLTVKIQGRNQQIEYLLLLFKIQLICNFCNFSFSGSTGFHRLEQPFYLN